MQLQQLPLGLAEVLQQDVVRDDCLVFGILGCGQLPQQIIADIELLTMMTPTPLLPLSSIV